MNVTDLLIEKSLRLLGRPWHRQGVPIRDIPDAGQWTDGIVADPSNNITDCFAANNTGSMVC